MVLFETRGTMKYDRDVTGYNALDPIELLELGKGIKIVSSSTTTNSARNNNETTTPYDTIQQEIANPSKTSTTKIILSHHSNDY